MKHIYNNIGGWFGFKKQYDYVFEVIRDHGVFVEVGSYLGKSLAYAVVENFNRNKNLKIHCVDNWAGNPYIENYMDGAEQKDFDNLYNKFLLNTDTIKDLFTCHRMLSWEASNLFQDSSVDYVMIDAGHDYNSVKRDIESWWPKIISQGIMGGDDFSYHEGNEVRIAVEEFCSKHNLKLNIMDNIKKGNPNRISKVKNWFIIK